MAEGSQAPEKEKAVETQNAEALDFNDKIVDMLMLLDYETRFCPKENLKPLSRTFFSYQAQNPALQFKYFTSLVSWCLELVRQPQDWNEYDDPGTLTRHIVTAFQNLGMQVDFAPAKLRQGWGDTVCQALARLLEEVLRRTGWEYGVPSYPDEGLADEADVDSDAEIHSVGEDDMPDQEDDDLMYQEEAPVKNDDDDDHGLLETNIDPKDWLLEIERVAPKLKVAMPNDAKEWRTHLQQTKGFKQVIEAQFPNSKQQLDKLSKELQSTLERIRSKEQFINNQFEHRALDYRQQQEEVNTIQSQYTQLNEEVMNLQKELKDVTEDLETVKQDMEERSSTVTDTAPIVKMKDAFKRLRADTRQLEVRIGVVSHTLMQAKLRQRPQETNRALYPGGPEGKGDESYDADDS